MKGNGVCGQRRDDERTKGLLLGRSDQTGRCEVHERPTSKRRLLYHKGNFHGGKMMLLQGKNREELLKVEKEWFDSMFADIRKWSPTTLPREIFVWIQCFGVPPQAWEEEFFSMLAKRWGKLVELESKTKSKERMDIGSFFMATSFMDKIDTLLKVKVGDVMVDIRMIEDPLETLGWEKGGEDNTSLSQASNEDEILEFISGRKHHKEETSIDRTKGIVQQTLSLSGEKNKSKGRRKVNRAKEKVCLPTLGGGTCEGNEEKGKGIEGVTGSRETVVAETAEVSLGTIKPKQNPKVGSKEIEEGKNKALVEGNTHLGPCGESIPEALRTSSLSEPESGERKHRLKEKKWRSPFKNSKSEQWMASGLKKIADQSQNTHAVVERVKRPSRADKRK
ncbi:hypothetical protein RIF29_38997 [Crotalaria pallida]|uniref:DUF4283 domain-containing protein n=1 Tax=Crotalaria pallida TaxID=3830 RepID=A0AAN9E0V5_CROPI